jgi:acetyl esterase
LAAALRLGRRRPGIVRFLLLYYGLYGFGETPSRRRFADPVYGLTPAKLRFYEACYLGTGTSSEPVATDLLASCFSGLPPVFIAAATLDPLLDDSLALSEALTSAGGDAELRIYEGVLHGFLHWSRLVPTAAQALDDGACALKKSLFKPLP